MANSLPSRMESDLEEMVTCAICTSRMKEPKHLQCQHAFCAQCLEDWMASPGNINSNKVPCPSCRHPTALPARGVGGLPADFNKNVLLEMLGTPSMLDKSKTQMTGAYASSQNCTICQMTKGYVELALSFCSDCEEYLCGECLGNHNSEPALKDHCVILGLGEELQAHGYLCDLHNGKKLAYHCPACMQLICSVCIRTEHLGHGAQTMEEAANERKKSLEGAISLLNDVRSKVEGTSPSISCRDQVDAMIDALHTEIIEHARHAKTAVDKWLSKAVSDLHKRKNVLYLKIEKKSEYLTMLSSLRSHYEKILDDPDPRCVLSDFDELLSRAEPLLNPDTRALTVAKWSFVPLVWPSRLGYLEQEGSAHSNGHSLTGPHNMTGLGEETPAKSSRRESSESTCEQYMGPGKSMECVHRMTRPTEDIGILNEIADMLDFRNSNVPSNKSRVVSGQLKVRAQKTWVSSGGGGQECEQLASATDVLLGPDDWVLVADPARGRVQRLWFDDHSRLPETILQDATPRRMALSADGSIAVTDQGYVHMLAVKAQQSISARPKWTPLEMVQPFAVAFVEETSQLVLTDMHDRRVVVYDENLRHQRSFGGTDVFGSPNCICSDHRGRVLVTDQTKNNVQAFTMDGQFLWKVDHFKPHQPMVTPSGVSVDEHGQIFVGCLDGRTGVFSSDGRFVCLLVDQFDTVTSVSGMACRRAGAADNVGSGPTLLAVCGATTTDQSMVRLWQVPDVTTVPRLMHGSSNVSGASDSILTKLS